ncbi:putative glyceraldehyde-3-phosphate dehydrogenase [Trypanosoma cruzi]|uniref:Putative glyceraldehyde-3-phosphate dehydrogenase n=1 Tax=Trypanosoma cruzi TaxID=5693 RepID=A0A2V2WT96_TRYCR|nr:putative glyceraldehyde-3-phosphate dehydrogenase [Trypanosoma cruzi]
MRGKSPRHHATAAGVARAAVSRWALRFALEDSEWCVARSAHATLGSAGVTGRSVPARLARQPTATRATPTSTCVFFAAASGSGASLLRERRRRFGAHSAMRWRRGSDMEIAGSHGRTADGEKTLVTSERGHANLGRDEVDTAAVIELTGLFLADGTARGHAQAGAKKPS